MNISSTSFGKSLARNEERGSAPTPFNEVNSKAFSKSWNWDINVPALQEGERAIIHATLGADDNATLDVGELSLALLPRGQYGGGSYDTKIGQASIEPGTHRVSMTYDNVSLPEGMANVAVLDYSIWVEVINDSTGSSSSYIPEEIEIEPIDNDDDGEDEPCQDFFSSSDPSSSCPCPEDGDNGEGDNGESSSNPCEGNAGGDGPATYGVRSIASICSSSAAKRVTARGGHKDMLWRANFGTFRGMPGLPDGNLVIQGKTAGPTLWSPAALYFDHPMESEIRFADAASGLKASSAFQIVKGSRKINGYCYAGNKAALIAGSAKRGGKVSYALSANGDDSKVASESYLSIKSKNGAESRYTAASSAAVKRISSYTAKNGRVYTQSDMSSCLNVVKNENGTIQQIMNKWDGLMSIENITSTGYQMSFYAPHQVGSINTRTGRYVATGSPFKTIEVSGDPDTGRLTITETTNGRESYPISYWQNESGAWCMSRGLGEDAIYTLSEKQVISDNQFKLITTVQRGEYGTPVSCVCETYIIGRSGHLCISRIEGYGTDYALETSYEYDTSGRKIKEIAPDGSDKTWAYDDAGRETVNMVPWAGGGYKATYTHYRYSNDSNLDISYQRIVLTATAMQLKRTDYTYLEENHIKRVEKTMVALGASEARTEVVETWLGSAPALKQGRMRMKQGIDGVQTWYDYEYDTTYNSVYKVTTETRVAGETVPGHSRRTVTYVSAEGNNMRKETYILLSSGDWAQLDGETYEYDSENRWIKKTRDNGRYIQREMMCCGPAFYRDEDGITYSYSYNSARQQIEIIRGEIVDGDKVITPETVIEQIHDAQDLLISKRVDKGPLSTVETYEYDLLGRYVRSTDVLGRVTQFSYALGGREMITQSPTGATLICKYHADGSLMQEYGSGQRATYHEISVSNIGVIHCIYAQSSGVLLMKEVINGFNEITEVITPTPEALVSKKTYYDSNGLKYKEQVESLIGEDKKTLAPVLFTYGIYCDLIKETRALSESPTPENSYIKVYSYRTEAREDGIYEVITETKTSLSGAEYSSNIAKLISALGNIAQKTISTDKRGNVTTERIEYGVSAKHSYYKNIPTSNITTQRDIVDGFCVFSRNSENVTHLCSRLFNSTNLIVTVTDARGNTTTIIEDKAGRVISETDAAGASKTTIYNDYLDVPAVTTYPDGKTECCTYDIRGRLSSSWGTRSYPVCYAYDDANRTTSVKTFRLPGEVITTEVQGRIDGDLTEWIYDEASGFELGQIVNNSRLVTKEYGHFGLQTKQINARGQEIVYEYETTRGLLTAIHYSDGSPSESFEYDHLNNLIRLSDSSGVHCFGYNEYSEKITDELTINEAKHIIQGTPDYYGRLGDFKYSRNNTAIQQISLAYGQDGRIVSAGFIQGNAIKNFSYSYMPGTSLLQGMTMPNNMTLSINYEESRNVIDRMVYKRGTTDVVVRTTNSDNCGRIISVVTARNAMTRTDSFTYNGRSELSQFSSSGKENCISYDNIGNRISVSTNEKTTTYTSNELNQYSTIINQDENGEATFCPEYDADGNQTRVQTRTGVWQIVYNARNQAIEFINSEEGLIVSCTYDSMGRRASKKVERVSDEGTEIISHIGFIYKGFLQIAAINLLDGEESALWTIFWEPSNEVSARPLAIQKDSSWFVYGIDSQKNVTEVFGQHGYIRNTYTYTPFGATEGTGDVEQPFKYSAEYEDIELGLYYYNFRYLNPIDGRWLSRDVSLNNYNTYSYIANQTFLFDLLGLRTTSEYEWHHLITQKYYKDNPGQITREALDSHLNGIFIRKAEHQGLGPKAWQAQMEKTIGDANGDLAKAQEMLREIVKSKCPSAMDPPEGMTYKIWTNQYRTTAAHNQYTDELRNKLESSELEKTRVKEIPGKAKPVTNYCAPPTWITSKPMRVITKVGGPITRVVGATSDVHAIVTAPEAERVEVATKIAASHVGGAAGTAIGAAVGSCLGPVGTVVGAAAGGFVGSVVAEWVVDWF